MFGFGGGAAKPEWGDMYFHQKLQHLVDTGADFVFSKVHYWVPCIAASMAASLFVFSQGDFVPNAYTLLSTAVLPHPAATTFGQRLPAEAMGGGAPEGDEGDEEIMLDIDADDQ